MRQYSVPVEITISGWALVEAEDLKAAKHLASEVTFDVTSLHDRDESCEVRLDEIKKIKSDLPVQRYIFVDPQVPKKMSQRKPQNQGRYFGTTGFWRATVKDAGPFDDIEAASKCAREHYLLKRLVQLVPLVRKKKQEAASDADMNVIMRALESSKYVVLYVQFNNSWGWGLKGSPVGSFKTGYTSFLAAAREALLGG